MTGTSVVRTRLRLALLVTLGLAIVGHDRLLGGFTPVFFGITPRPLVDGLPFEARAYVGFHGPRWAWVWGDPRVSVGDRVLTPAGGRIVREWSGTSLPVWLGTEPDLLATPLAPMPSGSNPPAVCNVDGIRVRTLLGVVRRLPAFTIPIVPGRLPADSNQAVALERAMSAVVGPSDDAWGGWRSKLDDPAQRAAILAENAEALAWWDRARARERFERNGDFRWEWNRALNRLLALVQARSAGRGVNPESAGVDADDLAILELATTILEDRDEVAPADLVVALDLTRHVRERLRHHLETASLDEGASGSLVDWVGDLERVAGRFGAGAAIEAFYTGRYAQPFRSLAEANSIAPLLDAGGRMLGWAARRWSLDGGIPVRKSAVLRGVPWAIVPNQWEGLLAFKASPTCVDGIHNTLTIAARLCLELRTMSVAIALRTFEADVGRWPADSTELHAAMPGGLPRDPFADGALLRYRVIGEQAVVWGVAAGDGWEPAAAARENEGFAWRLSPAQ
ncbi:MAG: hypothetical protein IPK07_20130 [Deltaproteobacteria bacterium]|nr:hypothetical protein [Deltaproteobacteria bacterium]